MSHLFLFFSSEPFLTILNLLGAGKTHTMMGNSRIDDATGHGEAGIIPNALADVFHLILQRQVNSLPGESWIIFVSFMEVYNEQVIS